MTTVSMYQSPCALQSPYHWQSLCLVSHHYSQHITTVTISLQSPYHYSHHQYSHHISTVTISLQSPYTLLQCPHFRWDAQSTANTLGAGHTLPQLSSFPQLLLHLSQVWGQSRAQTDRSDGALQSWQQQHWVHCEERMRMYVTCVCMVSDWMIVSIVCMSDCTKWVFSEYWSGVVSECVVSEWVYWSVCS